MTTNRFDDIEAWEAEVQTHTTGATVAGWIRDFAERTKTHFVSMSAVGGGPPRDAGPAPELDAPGYTVLTVERLVELAARKAEFEFGAFYFCATRADADAIAGAKSGLEQTLSVPISFGIVDSFYVAIYGRDPALLAWLDERFELERVYEGPASGLQFYG